MKRRTRAATILAAAAAGLLALSLYLFWRSTRPVEILDDPAISLPPPTDASVLLPPPPTAAEPVPEGDTEEAEPDDGLPTDRLFCTVPRQKYRDGQLQLIIPKLQVDVPVLNGTDRDTLREGEGLYDYAQLPSELRSNTSIAGHRNRVRGGKAVLDRTFSYLDRLEEGDCLYLRDEETIYQYVFEFQQTVTPDDWGPIYKTDHSCVTLTTCTPVGVSDYRLVVRGRLYATYPASTEYDYPPTIAEEATTS